MADVASFDPLAALKALREGGVDFVLIGGVAARLHGSPSLTRDIDICYDRDRENVERHSYSTRERCSRATTSRSSPTSAISTFSDSRQASTDMSNLLGPQSSSISAM